MVCVSLCVSTMLFTVRAAADPSPALAHHSAPRREGPHSRVLLSSPPPLALLFPRAEDRRPLLTVAAGRLVHPRLLARSRDGAARQGRHGDARRCAAPSDSSDASPPEGPPMRTTRPHDNRARALTRIATASLVPHRPRRSPPAHRRSRSPAHRRSCSPAVAHAAVSLLAPSTTADCAAAVRQPLST